MGAARAPAVGAPRAALLPKTFELEEKAQAHQDFLLKEMMWMSADFEGERKRHHLASKKRGRALVAHFKTRETKAGKAAKEEQAALRRQANRTAREIKGFWHKISKIVAYKQRVELEEVHRRSMDKQLVFLVKQTEKYSGALAASVSARSGSHAEAMLADAKAAAVPAPRARRASCHGSPRAVSPRFGGVGEGGDDDCGWEVSDEESFELQVGDRVESNWMSTGEFYPGVVSAVHKEDGTFDIFYDDGETEARVPLDRLRPGMPKGAKLNRKRSSGGGGAGGGGRKGGSEEYRSEGYRSGGTDTGALSWYPGDEAYSSPDSDDLSSDDEETIAAAETQATAEETAVKYGVPCHAKQAREEEQEWTCE